MNGNNLDDNDNNQLLSPIAARRLLFLQTSAKLPPRHHSFRWPLLKTLFDIQDELVSDLELTEDAGRGSGDDAYICGFLKELIFRLEKYLESYPNNQEIEVNGDILSTYALLKASSGITSSKPAARQVVHVFPSKNSESTHSINQDSSLFLGWNMIKLKEESMTISRGTTGLKTWKASLRLTGHLVAHPELLQMRTSGRGPKILELGCGLGFLSIVANKICSNLNDGQDYSFILTDLDGEVLENAKMSIKENCFGKEIENIQVHALDWIDVQKGEKEVCDWLQEEVQPDIVLAADIVFEPGLIEPLCSVLVKVLHRQNTSNHYPFALIASTVRNPDTFQKFLETMNSFGLLAQEVNLTQQYVNLDNLQILNDHSASNLNTLPLFPSAHDPTTEGHVKLLRITSSTK